MKYLIIVVCLIISHTCVNAQSDSTYSIDDMYMDFAAPEITAFSLLNVNGDEIMRPGNLQQFAYSTGTNLLSGGNITPGFAAELSPKNFKMKRPEGWWKKKFLANNYAFSIATASLDSVFGPGYGTGFATGFKWAPLDGTDPHGDAAFYNEALLAYKSLADASHAEFKKDSREMDSMILPLVGNDPIKLLKVYSNSFKLAKDEQFKSNQGKVNNGSIQNPIQLFTDSLMSALEGVGVTLSSNDSATVISIASTYVSWLKKVDEITEKGKQKILDLKESYRKANWNRGALMLSTGLVANSKDGTWQKLSNRTMSLAVTGAIPLDILKENNIKSRMLVQFKYDMSLLDSVEFESRYSFGGRFITGNADNRLSIEALYSSAQLTEDYKTTTFDQRRFLRYMIAAEFKLPGQGTWLEIGIGGQKFMEGKSDTVILPELGFRHAIQGKKRFN